MVLMARLARKVQKEIQVISGHKDQKETKETRVTPGHKGQKEIQVIPGLRVLPG